jgi:hypothetical protein
VPDPEGNPAIARIDLIDIRLVSRHRGGVVRAPFSALRESFPKRGNVHAFNRPVSTIAAPASRICCAHEAKAQRPGALGHTGIFIG